MVILVHLAGVAVIWHRLAANPAGMPEGGTLGFLVTLSLWATIAAAGATVLTFGPTLLLTTCV